MIEYYEDLYKEVVVKKRIRRSIRIFLDISED
jgi:hypothetical protein